MFSTLPVTSAILRFLSAQLRAGDPAWWRETARAWQDRRFVHWTDSWVSFITCLHFEALSDAEHPLVPYFPSCGGTAEADPAAALAEALRSAPRRFFENLQAKECRFYDDSSARAWTSAANLFFQRRKLPYYLVEVNSGGGLNLIPDLAVPKKGFRGDLVAARIGLDSKPLMLEDIGDRRWLTACVLPDMVGAIRALERAMDAAIESCRHEASFVQLVPCPAITAPAFVAKNIPADDSDVGLLFLNIGTTSRMTHEDYSAYWAAVLAMMRPWGDRALWVEVESVRGELFPLTWDLRAGRVFPEGIGQHIMARWDIANGTFFSDAASNTKFLSAGSR